MMEIFNMFVAWAPLYSDSGVLSGLGISTFKDFQDYFSVLTKNWESMLHNETYRQASFMSFSLDFKFPVN